VHQHVFQSKLLGCGQPGMASYDHAVLVHHDGLAAAELLQAGRSYGIGLPMGQYSIFMPSNWIFASSLAASPATWLSAVTTCWSPSSPGLDSGGFFAIG